MLWHVEGFCERYGITLRFGTNKKGIKGMKNDRNGKYRNNKFWRNKAQQVIALISSVEWNCLASMVWNVEYFFKLKAWYLSLPSVYGCKLTISVIVVTSKFSDAYACVKRDLNKISLGSCPPFYPTGWRCSSVIAISLFVCLDSFV